MDLVFRNNKLQICSGVVYLADLSMTRVTHVCALLVQHPRFGSLQLAAMVKSRGTTPSFSSNHCIYVLIA